jgi:hypothetical protein
VKWSATAIAWFSTFFENPLVRRVKRRMCIRIVRLARSTKLVEMSLGLGLPLMTSFVAAEK